MAMDSANAMMGHLPRHDGPLASPYLPYCLHRRLPSECEHSSSPAEHDESISQSPPTSIPAARLLLFPRSVRLLFKQIGANAVTR